MKITTILKNGEKIVTKYSMAVGNIELTDIKSSGNDNITGVATYKLSANKTKRVKFYFAIDSSGRLEDWSNDDASEIPESSYICEVLEGLAQTKIPNLHN